jgi:exonuclease SbcC
MIPLKLELRNFLSYGEDHPPLSLEGIRVACLSGPNGHGKSALLDALVWALWGEPRGGARAGDDLIRHGAREMEVALEFELHDVRHRVTRRRTVRGKTGTTDLQLESWDGSQWRTYTGGSLAETQRAITNLLHMTHDTFVHASFIAQGKADAFMTLTPQQRKQVLGEVLDLGQYDELATAAREGGRRARTECDRLTALISGIDAELAKRAEYQRKEEEAARTEREMSAVHDRLAAERGTLLEELERLRSVAREAGDKERAWRRAGERAASLEAQLRELVARVADAQRLVDRRGAIETTYARFMQVQEEERALAKLFDPWCEARDEMKAAEAAIERQRTQLVVETENLRRRAGEIERRLQSAEEASTALERFAAHLQTYETVEQELRAARTECEAVGNALAIVLKDGERLRDVANDVKRRIELLGSHEECPLCGQLLGADGLAAARERLTGELKQVEAELASTRKQYGEHQSAIKAAEARQRELEAKLAGRSTVERAYGDAEARVRAAEGDRKQLESVQQQVLCTQRLIDTGDFALEHRAQREEAAARLATIAYDPERHRKLREAREALHGAEEEMRKLEAARVMLATAESHQADLQSQRIAAEQESAALREEHRALAQEASRLTSVRSESEAKERELQTAGAALRLASQQLGEARQMVAWLADQEQERATLSRALGDTRLEVTAYDQLTEAFGKNGIQEMLVDRALPEIEERANEILSRLTGGRMRVELRTQRAGRTGGTISTLDVNVGDELGLRPYELFSGGERFRINFAIRIALSRYLATRAGAPLQMLAIDEGFGSQDREGCDRLIEAIRSIEDDFERVLVITHVEEIKDVFPVRIEVTKTARGSTFSIT